MKRVDILSTTILLLLMTLLLPSLYRQDRGQRLRQSSISVVAHGLPHWVMRSQRLITMLQPLYGIRAVWVSWKRNKLRFRM